ncbi:MAG TPA: amidohydrolase family protein [Frankiaceae bacterium]|nr:amidohydrolase family protein [Frankiaceae bacterium]
MIVDDIPVVDVDSHVSEPPGLWLDRLPRHWHDLAPRIESTDTPAGDMWFVDGRKMSPAWGLAPAGWREGFPSHPRVIGEVDPAAYDPVVRAQRLDEFGIRAQLLYPNLLGAHLRTFMAVGDSDFRLACFRAYNDFLADFAAAAPGRFVPIAALPFFDLDASVAEIERCAALGHKGILLANQPELAGLPRLRDPHWHPLFRAAEDAGLSVNFHVGFAMAAAAGDEAVTMSEEERKLWQAFADGKAGEMLPDIIKNTVVAIFMSNAAAITELIVSGLCDRYPDLPFVSVESGFGYVPWLLEALDWQWLNYSGRQLMPGRLLPSEYFRRQIYATFWFEGPTMQRLVDLYPDNLMFETDFPHPTCIAPGPASTSPTARDLIEQNLGSLPDGIRRKVLSETASRLYHLDLH